MPESSDDLSNIRPFYGGVKVPDSCAGLYGFQKLVLVLSVHDIERLVQAEHCAPSGVENQTSAVSTILLPLELKFRLTSE